MDAKSSRWAQLALRSKLAIRRQTSDVCNFDDVMEIYDDEADDAIAKLNMLQDIKAAFSSSQSSLALTVERDQDRKDQNGDVVISFQSSCESDEEQDSDAATALIQSEDAKTPNGEVGSPSTSNAPHSPKEDDENMPNGKAAPAPTSGTGNVKLKRKGGKKRHHRRSSVKFQNKMSQSLSSLDESEEDHPDKRKGSAMMSAPIQLQFTQLKKNAAFDEVRTFLVEEKYSRFVGTLVRAIKSDSVQAVKVMVEILKMFGFDLYEPIFRESVYTASMLHVALLFKRDEICLLLIKEFPKLVTVKYESEKFRNQTAFHIAAANGQYDILNEMLEAVDVETGKILLNTLADGSYFTDVHQEGALALTAAANSGLPGMIRELIKRGADPDAKGHKGNTVLHCIVMLSALYPQSDSPKVLFNQVWESSTLWWQERNPERQFNSENKWKMAQVDAFRYLLSIRNAAEMTVLSLAVHLHSNLTTHILNIEHIYKLPQTKFGAMSWSTYDVTEVTSFSPPTVGRANRYNSSSVLHILAHRAKLVTQDEDENFTDLIDEEPIRTLVEIKWQTYRFVYISWCVIHLLLMTCLTTVSLHFYEPNLNHNTFHDPLALHSNGNASEPIHKGMESDDVDYRAIHPWYCLFGVYPTVLIILEAMDMFSTGYSNFKSLDSGTSRNHAKYVDFLGDQWSATGNAPYRITEMIFSLSSLVWLCFHFMGDKNQDLSLSLVMIFGWIFMLYFTRCCRHICEFSIMVQKMFFQDCLYFIAVYSFFWLAFSTGMHVLLFYGNTPAPNFANTLYHMLNVITDAGDKSSADVARNPAAAGTLLSIYAVVSVVLLLNMLIAMMNTSYEAVKGSKTNVYRNQQLSVMLMFERRLWWLVWLCERSQGCTWSPKRKSNKKGSAIGTNDPNSTPQRIYLEITEKSCLQLE